VGVLKGHSTGQWTTSGFQLDSERIRYADSVQRSLIAAAGFLSCSLNHTFLPESVSRPS
jgi:hypothetical protein